MQEDIFPAAEKILSDIENVLRKDSSLRSFEIIQAEDNENKSPVFHQEECLGLASWCVQPLYCYAYRRLLEHRRNKHRREEPSTVARWLLGALLLNPDVSTFWNMRRELVRSRKLDAAEELSFTRLVLYHKPKCFEAFAYRRWLLPYILDSKGKNYDPPVAESPFCAEMEVARTCADRYANNYHAWSHRRYIMAMRESRGYTHPTLESEWRSTLAWCQHHVSDHSGHVYRQFLLKKCVLESEIDCNEGKEISNDRSTDDYMERCNAVLLYIGLNRGGSLEKVRHFERSPQHGATSSTLDPIRGEGQATNVSSSQLLELRTDACYRVLSYWVEEAVANENSIKLYDNHEALWSHRRFLAQFLVRLVDSYRTYSSYKAEIVDRQCNVKAVKMDGVEIPSNEREINTLLMAAFLEHTKTLVELARNRDPYEKMLVDRFLRFLGDLGLQI